MPEFPEPPPITRLREIGPDILDLPSGTPLARLFFRGGSHPVTWNAFRYWGPGQARFDPHLPDPALRPTIGLRGVLYVAGAGAPGAPAVCLAEVFQETRIVDTVDRTPWFVVFATRRPLRLLDPRGLWRTRVGASAAISSGSKARARRWGRAVYEAYPELDGIAYPSSMGGGADVYALFERSHDDLPARPDFHRPLADPALADAVLDAAGRINYALLPG